MRFFKRNEVADSKFTFRDVTTGENIDLDSAQYTLVYYDGPNEVEVVALTTLNKVAGKIGEYVCSWEIPEAAIENETYFVTASGVHPIEGTTLSKEDFYRVVPDNFFPGSAGGMTAKFTKP